MYGTAAALLAGRDIHEMWMGSLRPPMVELEVATALTMKALNKAIPISHHGRA